MDLINIANNLPSGTINRSLIYLAAIQENKKFQQSSIYWLINKMIDEGILIRVGRNKYCVSNGKIIKKTYHYPFPEKLNEIVDVLAREYPLIQFQAWEAIQFNWFVNHQIAHNLFFVEVEKMTENSVYEFLRDHFPDTQVLLKPDLNTSNIYAVPDSIIVQNLITEAPVEKSNPHGVMLEKLLVDMFVDKKMKLFIEDSEYTDILQTSFDLYIIDESKLFRYARRRGAEQKIRNCIANHTNIQLHI